MSRISSRVGIVSRPTLNRIFGKNYCSKLRNVHVFTNYHCTTSTGEFSTCAYLKQSSKRNGYAHTSVEEQESGLSDEVIFVRTKLKQINSNGSQSSSSEPKLYTRSNKVKDQVLLTSYGHVRFDANYSSHDHSKRKLKHNVKHDRNDKSDYNIDNAHNPSHAKEYSFRQVPFDHINHLTNYNNSDYHHKHGQEINTSITSGEYNINVNNICGSSDQSKPFKDKNEFTSTEDDLNYFDKHMLEDSRNNNSISDLPKEHIPKLKDISSELIESGNIFDRAIIEGSDITMTEEQNLDKNEESFVCKDLYENTHPLIESDKLDKMNYFDKHIIQEAKHNEFIDLPKKEISNVVMKSNKFNYFDDSMHNQKKYDNSLSCETKLNRSKMEGLFSHTSQLDKTDNITIGDEDKELNLVAKLKEQRLKNITLNTNKLKKVDKEDLSRNDKESDPKLIEKADAPKTAYELVKSIRAEKKTKDHNEPDPKSVETVHLFNPWLKEWKGKRDSRGFRILSEQVMDLERVPKDTVVTILKNSILYEDDRIVAISKPYNLASHGGPGIHNSVGKVLHELAQRVDKNLETLYLVHRLDKETTGVMLLAKSASICNRLGEMFKKREIVKKYVVITKGVPNPEEGVIDIPLTEGVVGKKYRMTLKPRYSSDMKKDLNIHQFRGMSGVYPAVTNYKVISSHGNAALIECQAETGVKHQIRCHLAFGLNAPILGDHKYSNLSKIAPQKLPPDILQRLGIRQTKVRHVAMHLHASDLIIPEFYEGRNLFIHARLPKHFVQNMKWLKLRNKR